MEVKLMTAEETDLEEILALQYLAYRSEAELVGDFSIQPLTQTMDELRGEFLNGAVIKAVAGEKIVGSVRGRTQDGTLFIGKLMVHPDWQNKGLGKKLLARIAVSYTHLDVYKRQKLQFAKEPLKNGTTVIIAHARHKLSDIIDGKVKRTILQIQ